MQCKSRPHVRPTNVCSLGTTVHIFCRTICLFFEMVIHDQIVSQNVVQVLAEGIVISTDVNKGRSIYDLKLSWQQ
jgi:hypothetical protein